MAITERPSTPEINFYMNQGADFARTLRWGADPVVQKAISAITQAAPPVLTVTAHGLVNGWPVWVADVAGMTDINNPFSSDPNALSADNDPYIVTVIDPNTISIAGLSSIGFRPYKSGGFIQYFTPQSLAGFTAKMQLRKPLPSTTVILELTNLSGITLDDTNKAVSIHITAAQTALLTLNNMVYDLRLTSGGGVPTRIAQGKIVLSPQVTRP